MNRISNIRHGLLLARVLLAALIAAVGFSACHEDHDDYYTTAIVCITLPSGMKAERMQGTVKLTNLNNKQTYTTASFSGTTASLTVLRGAYSIDVEGTVRYHDTDGSIRTANFRAAAPHCEILDHLSELSLDIIFM